MLHLLDAAWCGGGKCSSGAGSLVELGEDEGIGNLPLVNGVLLGYPFVYYVTAENVNQASAWLSSSHLRLFRCCLLPLEFSGAVPWRKCRLCQNELRLQAEGHPLNSLGQQRSGTERD